MFADEQGLTNGPDLIIPSKAILEGGMPKRIRKVPKKELKNRTEKIPADEIQKMLDRMSKSGRPKERKFRKSETRGQSAQKVRKSQNGIAANRIRKPANGHASNGVVRGVKPKNGNGRVIRQERAGGGSSGSHHPKKKWSSAKKVGITLMALLIAFITGAIGVLASNLFGRVQAVRPDTDVFDADQLYISSELQFDETGFLNIALFGLDTRKDDPDLGIRADTIMIASLNRETREVKLVSVFRDTIMQFDDGTFNKANAAYTYGGPQGAVSMLNRNLDLNIQHYVTVEFEGMVRVIDALGGVPIDVQQEEIYYINSFASDIIRNTGIDTWAVTTPGLQMLTGTQATAYARIRNVGNSDFQRAERQRTVFSEMANKAHEADVETIIEIVNEVFGMIETNFTLPEMVAYARQVNQYHIGETTGFPFYLTTQMFLDAGDSVIPTTLASNVTLLHEFLFGTVNHMPSSMVQGISSDIAYLSETTEGSAIDHESEGWQYVDPPIYNDFAPEDDNSWNSDFNSDDPWMPPPEEDGGNWGNDGDGEIGGGEVQPEHPPESGPPMTDGSGSDGGL
ncbi:MAG: LCP family protein [Lachnospiraceae bacterium]|nr:LCP family protein [Lachnospiraceae bacterium]